MIHLLESEGKSLNMRFLFYSSSIPRSCHIPEHTSCCFYFVFCGFCCFPESFLGFSRDFPDIFNSFLNDFQIISDLSLNMNFIF